MHDHHSQAKLWCDCPFWPDDGMCRLRDCSVCECPDNEFPESFKKPHILSSEAFVCQEGKPQATVDRTLDRKAFKGWTEIDNPWTNDDETDNGVYTKYNTSVRTLVILLSGLLFGYLFPIVLFVPAEMTYVNLQLNPERYTGYTGPSARRIWDAVYSENCPKCNISLAHFLSIYIIFMQLSFTLKHAYEKLNPESLNGKSRELRAKAPGTNTN